MSQGAVASRTKQKRLELFQTVTLS